MNPDKQRIAIAEACGWFTMGTLPEGERYWGRATNPDNPCAANSFKLAGLPDYLNDLNAMHEAEATLTGETNYYHQLLIRMNNYDGLATVRATAAQRAEAFLRTIGKWEEV